MNGSAALRITAAAATALAAAAGIALAPAAVAAPPAAVPQSAAADRSAALPQSAAAGQPDPVRQSSAADRAVAALQRQIAAQGQRLNEASAALDTAQSRYNAALARRHGAEKRLRKASADERAAQDRYRRSQRDLVAVAVSNYQNAAQYGSADVASMTTLLVSSNPGALLGTATTQQQVDAYQVNVLDSVRQALAAKSRAVQQRRAALGDITAQTVRLRGLEQAAARSLEQTSSAMRAMQTTLTRAKATQQQAEAVLSRFLGGWSQAVPGRAAELNRTYAKLAGQIGHPVVASSGHWTAAVGASVAWRALRMISTPYAWAGGNASGPTTGVCAAGAAANDCLVVGFDCSGLSLYSWAPYLALPHYAASQYLSGRVHPRVPDLKLGDLVFWSTNGSVAGIHHVAIYVGSGNVVQAPQSGDIVRVTPLANVAAGYFGATRPMS